MNASNARALTAMKQKVKKTAKEYEADIKRYQEVRIMCPRRLNSHANDNVLQDPETIEREFKQLLSAETAPVVPKVKKSKAAALESDDEGDFATVGKGGKSMVFTPESIFKNLQLVQEARGKKVSILI